MAEQRLIDANKMREDWLENGENEYVYDTNAVLGSIDAQPTVDAVPVVRCKNCNNLKHHWCDKKIDSPDPNMVRDCQYFWQKTNADRIRAMTDEELADMRVRYNPETDMYTNDTGEAYYDFVSAMEAELEWLQQPAEGD